MLSDTIDHDQHFSLSEFIQFSSLGCLHNCYSRSLTLLGISWLVLLPLISDDPYTPLPDSFHLEYTTHSLLFTHYIHIIRLV